MKIALIKLGALGDVVRTLPIAEAIKKKCPGSEISWITKQNAVEIFEGNPFVDNLFYPPFSSQEKYDILYNFDIEEEATALASSLKADKKYGFYKEGEYPMAFNISAEYYLNTLFDDELKKTNKKTYQEMMFEAAELHYNKEIPKIYLNEKDKAYADNFIKENKMNKTKLIGIHMGSGARWPSKAWAEGKIKDFIKKIKELGHNAIVFGGPEEVNKIDRLIGDLRKSNISVYKNNPHNSIKEFASLVNLCDKMVCSDSFSLHISLALGKPTTGLFFCTTPHEVEGYSLLKKIVSPLFEEFFPEKQDQFNEGLVNSISAEEVISSIISNNNK